MSFIDICPIDRTREPMDELSTKANKEEYTHIIIEPFTRAVGTEINGVMIHDQRIRPINNSNLPNGLATFIKMNVGARTGFPSAEVHRISPC